MPTPPPANTENLATLVGIQPDLGVSGEKPTPAREWGIAELVAHLEEIPSAK